MARFIKIGETVVLDPARVRVARISQELPELRMMLREPKETLFVPAPNGATAQTWLDDLRTPTQLPRVGDALLPIQLVRWAQVQENLVAKVKDQDQDRGPGLRLMMNAEDLDPFDLPADSVETARAWLDLLLRQLNGEEAAEPAPPEGDPPPVSMPPPEPA